MPGVIFRAALRGSARCVPWAGQDGFVPREIPRVEVGPFGLSATLWHVVVRTEALVHLGLYGFICVIMSVTACCGGCVIVYLPCIPRAL
jgi:hypothetical protein